MVTINQRMRNKYAQARATKWKRQMYDRVVRYLEKNNVTADIPGPKEFEKRVLKCYIEEFIDTVISGQVIAINSKMGFIGIFRHKYDSIFMNAEPPVRRAILSDGYHVTLMLVVYSQYPTWCLRQRFLKISDKTREKIINQLHNGVKYQIYDDIKPVFEQVHFTRGRSLRFSKKLQKQAMG